MSGNMDGHLIGSDRVCWPDMLRMVRGTRFWTLTQMAAQLKVSPAALRSWESGYDVPDPAAQRLVRDLLDTPVGEAQLTAIIRGSTACRYLFRADRSPQVGKPSRILELSDAMVAEQPFGRDVFFAPRTPQHVELTAESDAVLNSQGNFYGGEMVMATMRLIWLQYVQGGMTVRHALTRWVPMRLPDGTPVCLYERRTVTPSAYLALPAQPIFTPLDGLVG
ncbi:DNA-binding transcriptional regulator [Niveispirillum sp.]|uniref:helix-turn-helix domain-containing protein n=1 Tax=Niveispirillum sp. TaxID=1917217 RepID=UPI001B797FD8|nr:helix-turn-helix transcriptional regulator [Niveispirillum sp.]MBP7334505.1 helix-turn-helix transcriptional regulator [Niveispirillum sp.]